MVRELGLGWWGGILVVLATLTTNFVNIYMSALALKSLRPATADRTAIWLIGGIGAAISVLSSTWLDQMANFTLVLAGLFVPVGGILLAHFVLRRVNDSVDALYQGPGGAPAPIGSWSLAGMSAWLVGAAVFYLAQPIGGVAPRWRLLSPCTSVFRLEFPPTHDHIQSASQASRHHGDRGRSDDDGGLGASPRPAASPEPRTASQTSPVSGRR
jgi:hypothetical protein